MLKGRALRLAALAQGPVLIALLLAGCTSSDGVAGNYANGPGYVSGDGKPWVEIPADQRGAPVAFSGPTIDGSTFDSASLAGRIAVVNFWYAGCAPCRVEAPTLVAAAAANPDVQFVGVNVYDGADVAKAFDDKYGIAYPSILDAKSVSVQYAFAGDVPPNAVPTTLILDKQGRVAARISGLINPTSALQDMIEKVESEG